jgi:hypothetical protein
MEKTSLLKIVLNVVLIVLLVNLLVFAGYFAYLYWPRAAEVLKIKDYDKDINLTGVSGELRQFEDSMRFNHNELSYFVVDCEAEKILRLKKAFSIIENETGIIKFYETKNFEKADIHVACSETAFETEENVFIAGEGGPIKFLNLSLYPLILKGKIILYEKSECDYPITELHEVFHVLGFDHINQSDKIMYPYVDCKQRIDPEAIDILVGLYSIEPAAELYFENASAVKTGIYLNFSVQINNEGLIDAKKVSLEVYGNERKIDSFELKDIGIGVSQSFWVSNLKLDSISTRKIMIKIISGSREYNEKNNVIELEVL